MVGEERSVGKASLRVYISSIQVKTTQDPFHRGALMRLDWVRDGRRRIYFVT